MKNKKFLVSFFLTILCVLTLAVGANSLAPTFVNAADGTINNANYSSTYQFDASLFSAVRRLAIQLNNGNALPGGGFSTDLFFSGYKTCEVDAGSDGEKIKEDLDNGILNLTTGTNAKYDCLVNAAKIKSIAGLNDLTLSNIRTLILDDNEITRVSSTDFESMPNLSRLRIANNQLSSVELSADLSVLNSVDFSGNQLTQIDLSNLQIASGVRPSAILTSNLISDYTKIVFPNSKLSSLDLSFNNMLSLAENDVNNINSNLESGKKAILLVQGSKDMSSFEMGDKITIFKDDIVTNLSVVMSYQEESSMYVSGEDNSIVKSNTTDNIETIYIPIGKIKIEFLRDGTVIDDTMFPSLSQEIVEKLSVKLLNVKLPGVSYKIYSNNKVVKELTQKSNMDIVFAPIIDENIPNLQDVKDNVLIYTYLGNNIPSKKATLSIKEKGSFNCNAYATFDGLNSKTTTITATVRDMTGITIAIVLVIIVIVLGGVAYFLIRWIKDGAGVAPLTDKEIYNIKKSERKKYGRSIEDEDILILDQPRHKDDNFEQDRHTDDDADEVLDNLNDDNVKHDNIESNNLLDSDGMPKDLDNSGDDSND